MTNIYRFAQAGDTIIDRENDWSEIGTYQDIAAEVLELRAENERLRALLPDVETLSAIKKCIVHAGIGRGRWDEARVAQVWINRIEGSGE